MKLGKLTKRLKKELAAHPKKGAVLALASLAALWLYAPLITSWFKGKPDKAKNGALVVSGNTSPSSPTAGSEASAWIELHAWRLADPLAQPAMLSAAARNPFARPEPSIVTEVAEVAPVEQATTAPTDFDPDEFGLVLQAISIGPKRFAQISGKTVRENDVLTFPRDDQSSLKVRVTSITPTEVVLVFGDQTTRLKMPHKSLGNGEVFVGLGSRK